MTDILAWQISLDSRKLVINMYPIEFPEQNTVFVAEGCDNLPACRQYNEQFHSQEVISCWELSDNDCMEILRQIENGKKPVICLDVVGGQPPVGLWVRA